MDSLPQRLTKSLRFAGRVAGLTHNFYRYPARFSPQFARQVIEEFSNAGDTILDPFMGGGTAIVEALALGRRAVGTDINALACFVTAAKTTPLSVRDRKLVEQWVSDVQVGWKRGVDDLPEDSRLRNLPERVSKLGAAAIDALARLTLPRQRRFARCALLRTLQWAVDCRNPIPQTSDILDYLEAHVDEMFDELDEFCLRCSTSLVHRNQITGRRQIACCPAEEAAEHLASYNRKVGLILTSPPYPGVHVLYHRWQVHGRRETPAPYWLAELNDGFPESYYTMGTRQEVGNAQYFSRLVRAYKSLRPLLRHGAHVVQLVAFSNVQAQLRLFLEAMEAAGYQEVSALSGTTNAALWRPVPNRKWYTSLQDAHDAASEVFLCHRPG
jgi:hypothetical protein